MGEGGHEPHDPPQKLRLTLYIFLYTLLRYKYYSDLNIYVTYFSTASNMHIWY